MKQIRSIGAVLGSHKMYLGFLLGVAAWLFFGLVFGRLGAYTMEISMLLTLWVSGVWQPKRAAIFGILVGFPAGIFHGFQYLAQMGPPATAEDTVIRLVAGLFVVPAMGLMLTAWYALIGLAFGEISQLYNRKAIF